VVAYVIRKILFSILILFAASIVIFWLVSMAGDPLTFLRQNPQVRPEDLERLTAAYGLDKPLWQQYVVWITDFVRGDMGLSFKQNAPVSSIVVPRIWPTVLLMGTSLLITVLIAVPFGVYSAIKKYSVVDNVGTFLSFVGYSMPTFWLGLILQLVLGIYLTAWAGVRIFYTSGMRSPGDSGFIDLLQHLALPAIALSVISVAQFSRFQRAAMLDILSSDFLRTARAKGVSSRVVYLKHALRNALMPTVTLLAIEMGLAFGGAVVTETVFAWPGLGFLLADSLYKNDYNVARALILIGAALVIFFNLLADIAYSFVDPRVSYD
jgi:peptide/nickel transport system permease protein